MRWLFQRLVCVEPQDIPDEQKSQSSFTLDKLRTGKAGGFQGRPEKDPDVCYSFWVGASIQVGQAYIAEHFKMC